MPVDDLIEVIRRAYNDGLTIASEPKVVLVPIELEGELARQLQSLNPYGAPPLDYLLIGRIPKHTTIFGLEIVMARVDQVRVCRYMGGAVSGKVRLGAAE